MGNMLEVMIRMYSACGLPESRITKERCVASVDANRLAENKSTIVMNIKFSQVNHVREISKICRNERVTCRSLGTSARLSWSSPSRRSRHSSLSPFHPDSDARINPSYSAQLVEHFIHALQPDALTAGTITLNHLLYAHCTTMSQIVSDHPLRHGVI